MPSTYTPLLRLTLPADGELVGTWGQTVNNGITSLEEAAIAGSVTVPVTDGADTVLTVANGATDQARYNTLRLSGALTAQRNVIVPTSSKNYFVRNVTTGGFGVLVKTVAGSGIVVPPGQGVLVYCDGVNVIQAITSLGGPLLVPYGTAVAPGLGVGDTNTGLFGVATNVLGFTTGGVERARFTALGDLLVGSSASFNNSIGTFGVTPRVQVHGTTYATSALALNNFFAGNATAGLYLGKSRGVLGAQGIVVDTDVVGAIVFNGSDGVNMREAARIQGIINGTPGVDSMPGALVFYTTPVGSATPTTRFVINSAGETAIGTSTSPGVALRVIKPLTGAANALGVAVVSTVSADVTTAAYAFNSNLTTGAAFALPTMYHYRASPLGLFAGSSVATMYGFSAEPGLGVGGTAYGFWGGIAASTNKWNLYMNGTADNYLNGRLLQGSDQSIDNKVGVTVFPARVQFSGTTSVGQSINRFSADTSSPILILGKSRSTAVGGYAIVAANDTLGQIVFNGTDGVEMQEATRIATVVSGVPAAGSVGGSLVFGTSPGVGGAVNRVIISHLGDMLANVNVAVPALSVNNQMVFNLTSNTNLRVSVRGTDGVTRVANIVLA